MVIWPAIPHRGSLSKRLARLGLCLSVDMFRANLCCSPNRNEFDRQGPALDAIKVLAENDESQAPVSPEDFSLAFQYGIKDLPGIPLEAHEIIGQHSSGNRRSAVRR